MKKISIFCICLLLTVITNSQKQGGRKSETVLEGGVKADATFFISKWPEYTGLSVSSLQAAVFLQGLAVCLWRHPLDSLEIFSED